MAPEDRTAEAVTLHVVGAAIIRDGRCLAAQRSATMREPLAWELPGGKVEPGEDPRSALAREIREELGVEITTGELLGSSVAMSSSGQRIALDVYRAALVSGEPRPLEHAALRWLAPEDFAALTWAPADVPLLSALAAALRG